ncbi:MAG: hypothetical protein NZ608_00090 [candidate division WOR-3 bacterium]|nr:hypothetical protein [candidate division WOR-3 bacterium]
MTSESPSYFLSETPKPLVAFFFYFFSPPFNYLLVSFLISLSFFYFLKISENFTGSFFTGLFSFLYAFLFFEDSWQNLLSVYWVFLYIPLMIIGFYYFLIKNYWKYGILNLLAGLIRPESWFIAVIFLFLSFFRKERKSIFLFLPFLAPLIWFFFDLRAFSNPFYSFVITARYPIITGIPLVKPEEFFLIVFKDLSNQTGWLFWIISFLVLILIIFFQRKKLKNYLDLLMIVVSPFIFYFFLSFRGGVLPMRRFFLLSLFFLSFFLFHIFDIFLEKKSVKFLLQTILFLFLFFINFPIDKIRDVKWNLKDEEEKMIALETSVPLIKNFLLNLKPKYLIVPFRRKAIFEYYFSEIKENLESFREIIALKKNIKDYENSVVFYLIKDFAGVEMYFDFLSQFRSHLLKEENLLFEPLSSHPWYRIYFLKRSGVLTAEEIDCY